MSNETGILYICATPIGNMEDMTYRAVRILREVAVIAAEDTRHSRKLLSHFDIHTPLVSYHEHNKGQAGRILIDRLLAGESVAVISDAGMPAISDPGADLAALAIEQGITVTPIPGPNAALCALVGSGIDPRLFTFVGFLPKTAKKKRELLLQLADHPFSLIFYEAPHHLRETLGEIQKAFGDRQAAVAREITKKFEEFVRGKLSFLREHFDCREPRGECTLVIAGAMATESPVQTADSAGLAAAVGQLVAEGQKKKDAIRMVASEYNVGRRTVYQAVLEQNP
ncbi:16S rRNA (cytidine(1402)-2'-O)-methyltransferase [Acetonema longum]|uniref:Ribosomal RNA small subunit methyltransferase I n=1 Tax=Acetonema longum DSM 6540 TaxID=1009370 RepID=F7NDD5_9FIRM|nr:16S rRNA (cytidine(1402)-2'-O)-methyltransferase [Acetonema longum]EGO65967.1 uroporphyrin-III C/tetrapyrrole (Corrin/Porphyrin) methyltransferase [Acetonema longum DSM 6540]